MRTRTLMMIGLFFSVGCSEPPDKTPNADTNNSTVNSTSSNSTSGNNAMSNNTAGNNTASSNNAHNSTTAATDLFANQFEQSCQYDGDCLLVDEGDQCECGGEQCFDAAIALGAQEAWNDAGAAIDCGDEPEVCPGVPCSTEQLAACAAGTCTVRDAVYVDATGWDTSCSDDSDCAIVHEGEVCSNCVCGGTAVNVSELPKYQQIVDGVECTPGPDFCDCATVSEAWCDAGTCEPGVNPQCVGIDSDGFFSNCNACGENCDTIDTQQGSRNACGCESSADCPCGLRCGDYEIAPNIVVGGVCVR